MPAIVTDQIRISNTKNFVEKVISPNNSYYIFVGLANPTNYQSDWNDNTPYPKDNFNEENDYWDTMIAMKKIQSSDIRMVVKKNEWRSGNTYDMYRHDYSASNKPPSSKSTTLYSSFFYVINSDYRVYMCLNNGTDPDYPEGRPSLDEPNFIDIEPRAAGTSGDGYIWKYLYTIKPSDIVKFDSTDYIPLPQDWETSQDYDSIRSNAVNGSIKTVIIKNRGSNVGNPNTTYTNVPIKGDGTGGKCTIVINNDSKVESITVSNQGENYTYGKVDIIAGNISLGTGGSMPEFDVIIPPKGGHGYDLYRELGSFNVLLYSRIENDIQNPDFIIGNEFSRIGIVENPEKFSSNDLMTSDKASLLSAIKLTGTNINASSFPPDSYFTQTVSTGTTAIGRVVSYDKFTGVLKYQQDRSMYDESSNSTNYNGLEKINFTSTPGSGGSLTIIGQDTTTLTIDTNFSGISTSINNKTYYLGQTFTNGTSNPEVKKYSGNVIYVDNRPSVTRSQNQKEDIKIILQF